MKKCDSDTGSLVKQPQSRAWISYINDTNLTGYLVYPNCPFDYCLSISPPLNFTSISQMELMLSVPSTDHLCCVDLVDLVLASLLVASSCCLPCPSYWPALLIAITIAAILAGIVLVTLLLVLNMTVAVGTLNGLIFYANVVYANKSILHASISGDKFCHRIHFVAKPRYRDRHLLLSRNGHLHQNMARVGFSCLHHSSCNLSYHHQLLLNQILKSYWKEGASGNFGYANLAFIF